ncbi:hypothetical protein [Carboxylicivirga taeanensis]|uniref:hypothetical protein n=1 Tax=Carboxylicivirga taeanensis TaxID=1416875 RepID=UPI003F6DE208
MFESEGDAKKWAKDNNIRTGWFSGNKIQESSDGTWAINNKKEGTSIFRDNNTADFNNLIGGSNSNVITGALGLGSVDANGGGSWIGDALDWAKEHHYYGVEGNVTHGMQAGAICKNLIGFEIGMLNQTVLEGEFSNKKQDWASHELKPLVMADKVELFRINGAYAGFGGGYKLDNNYGTNVHNVNLGWTIFRGNVSFNSSGFVGGFVGLELSGGASVVWGVSGTARWGFKF